MGPTERSASSSPRSCPSRSPSSRAALPGRLRSLPPGSCALARSRRPGDLGQVSAPLRLFVGDLRLVPLQRARDLRCLAVEGVVPVLVRVLYAVAGPGAATVRLPALGRDGGDGDDPVGHGASLVCSSPCTTGIGRKRLRRTRLLLVSVIRAFTSSGARASR